MSDTITREDAQTALAVIEKLLGHAQATGDTGLAGLLKATTSYVLLDTSYSMNDAAHPSPMSRIDAMAEVVSALRVNNAVRAIQFGRSVGEISEVPVQGHGMTPMEHAIRMAHDMKWPAFTIVSDGQPQNIEATISAADAFKHDGGTISCVFVGADYNGPAMRLLERVSSDGTAKRHQIGTSAGRRELSGEMASRLTLGGIGV